MLQRTRHIRRGDTFLSSLAQDFIEDIQLDVWQSYQFEFLSSLAQDFIEEYWCIWPSAPIP